MTFEELRSRSSKEPEELNESLLRKGAGFFYSRQSKAHGDKAAKHFKDATVTLSRPAEGIEERLELVSKAMVEMNAGFQSLGDQNGSLTALGLIGVLLAEKGRR